MNGLVFFSILLLASGEGHPPSDGGIELQRQSHDHAIYELAGDPSLVRQFHEEIGSNWIGGELLDADEEEGIYRYWAYGWRTAPQSRSFMMPAVFLGLDLEIVAYEQTAAFPDLRSNLDEVSMGCGLSVDPFLILPNRYITFVPTLQGSQSTISGQECVIEKLRTEARFSSEQFGFFGNERSEDDSD
ncbi:hypothetical protein [uncultured Erythrobacter sp.]|uniref:hypothetical protein n=1 Tax=uncultured Erythrobacter sp. TaxID=263913 RepID=UPI0026389669|nr:hypothetical protein [uncultured Erythrobacter sp.]